MRTETGSCGFGSGTAASEPSTPEGSVDPSPVAKKATVEPRGAGLEAELIEPSWFRTAAGPWPLESSVKNPGWALVTARPTTGVRCPWYSTCTAVEDLPATAYGTMAA